MSIPSSKKAPNNLTLLEIRLVVFSLRENSLQVLVVPELRNQPVPFYELPCCVVMQHRSLDSTANKCLTEITGMHDNYLEQLYTYGEPTSIKDGYLVSIVYFAIIPTHFEVPLHEHNVVAWIPVAEMPPMAMNQNKIVDYALRRLQYKLEYTAVGFELLPKQFTFSELQRTYEIILGEKLDKRNFRRRILEAGVIETTDRVRSGEGRPARLYRYRPDAVAEVKARRLFP